MYLNTNIVFWKYTKYILYRFDVSITPAHYKLHKYICIPPQYINNIEKFNRCTIYIIANIYICHIPIASSNA